MLLHALQLMYYLHRYKQPVVYWDEPNYWLSRMIAVGQEVEERGVKVMVADFKARRWVAVRSGSATASEHSFKHGLSWSGCFFTCILLALVLPVVWLVGVATFFRFLPVP